MENLTAANGLMVRQKKEWGEILTGFETRNNYVISDTSGNNLYMGAETGGSVLSRLFLKAMRPFTIVLVTKDGREAFRIKRPFRFYFHRAEILDLQGRSLGAIERRFSLLRRTYSVLDTTGEEKFQLFGPLLRPWTFQIRQNGTELGKITKRWSGLFNEGFSDADNFGVTFPEEWDVQLKAVFLGAVFLIDFVHFENKD